MMKNQLATDNSQLATRKNQLATDNSQLTTRNSQNIIPLGRQFIEKVKEKSEHTTVEMKWLSSYFFSIFLNIHVYKGKNLQTAKFKKSNKTKQAYIKLIKYC